MNREQRALLAGETLSIMDKGFYALPDGKTISIEEDLRAACANTTLYQPEDYEALVKDAEAYPASNTTTFRVSNQTTLAAARELIESYPSLACLNFASAKNPGGGFLSGSQAQEESLARSSGLYATLKGQSAFYDYHRNQKTCLYSDRVIFSPKVPVFRDDSGESLPNPWNCSFLTAPAVNAGAVMKNEPNRMREIEWVMEQRTRMVLAVALKHRCEALVLGAWGCGVFQNVPATIAAIFARVFAVQPFRNKFSHVEFAIYDPTAEQSNVSVFAQRFGNDANAE